jgi:hypothetical protein
MPYAPASGGRAKRHMIACSSDNGERQYGKSDNPEWSAADPPDEQVRLPANELGIGCGRGWGGPRLLGEFDPTGGAGNGREGSGGQMKTIGVGASISVRNNETIGVQKRAAAWSSMAQFIGMSSMKTVTLPSPGAHTLN